MKPLKLYNFYYHCGRMGHIEGLFAAYPSEVDSIMGQEVYFGEVLGKHSEISVIISEDNIRLLSEDQGFINTLVEVTGGDNSISGHNPFDSFDSWEPEEEDEDE